MVKVWNVAWGSEPKQLKLYGSKSVSCVGFNSASTLIAAAGNDLAVNLIKLSTGMTITKELKGHIDTVTGCKFTNSNQLLTSSVDKTVRLWDITKGEQVKSMGCTSETHCLDVCGSGSEFASGHKSGDVRLWSLTQQKVMKVLSNIHSEKIECIKYIETRNQIVTLGRDHLIQVTDLRMQKTMATIEHSDFFLS